MKEKKKAVALVAPRYQRASKKQKGIILNEFIELTGYNRSYASYLLRIHGKKTLLNKGTILEANVKIGVKRKRQRKYDDKVLGILTRLWYIMDCICGKRLAPILKEVIAKLESFKEIRLDADTRKKLIEISPATIDRLLSKEKKKQNLKGRANTKPGTLLKNQIPIRTFSECNEKRPGFVEMDLVGHDGGDARGEFIQTLDVTDVCTGWTETQAVRNKAQVWVFEALEAIKGRLPFELLGIDSDNGSEFINHHLFRFCTEGGITFTRSRTYRKNDSCFVEQKNYSIVRRAVGYARYDTVEELRILNELYGYLRLYTNFFQPVMKLLKKTRIGSKVKKRYDKPQTPYMRIFESPYVPKENKDQLKKLYAKLNPAELKRQITKLQNKLLKLASLKESMRRQEVRISVGYSGMGCAEKIDYRANGEVGFSDLQPKTIIPLKIKLRQDKITKCS